MSFYPLFMKKGTFNKIFTFSLLCTFRESCYQLYMINKLLPIDDNINHPRYKLTP